MDLLSIAIFTGNAHKKSIAKRMTAKYQRLAFLLIGLVIAGIGTALILWSLNQNLMYFYTPSELKKLDISPQQIIKIGGLVQPGSVKKIDKKTQFIITDQQHYIHVNYQGMLPDLFRENQGVIATGLLHQNIFTAQSILAKHDENYIPEELKEKLESQGIWQGNHHDH